MYIFNLLLEGEQPTNNWGSLIIMGVLIVAIIGLFVWQTISGKKKQKEAQNMVNTLKIGDKVYSEKMEALRTEVKEMISNKKKKIK